MSAAESTHIIPDHKAETLLQCWGAHQRAEVNREVGLPRHAAGCEDYHAPDWEKPPLPGCTERELEHACGAMLVIRALKPRLWAAMRDHYQDGMTVGYQRAREFRAHFSSVWAGLDHSAESC